MSRVAEYLPNFVDGEREAATAGDRAALEALPFVRPWLEDDGFHRLSVDLEPCLRAPWGGPPLATLMAEYDEGTRWYVIAGVESPELYNLPEWKPVYLEQ